MGCLLKLGLSVNQDNTAVPSLSRLHLSSALLDGTSEIMKSLQEVITISDGERYIKDENDTFHLEKPSAWSLGAIADALPSSKDMTDKEIDDENRIIDYNSVIKRLVVHEKDPPTSKETPYFNHDAFYANLEHYGSQVQNDDIKMGKTFMYGEVVTSTNTLLEKYDPLTHLAFFTRLTSEGIRNFFDVCPRALLQQLLCKWLAEVEARMFGCLRLGH